MAKEMSQELKDKLEAGRLAKKAKDEEARKKLLADIGVQVREANKEATDEQIKKMVDKAVAILDADSKIQSALGALSKAILDKAKLSSRGGVKDPTLEKIKKLVS